MRFLITTAALIVAISFFVSGVGAAEPKYEANWQSLASNDLPEWIKDAKFGVYTHWGVYSVIAKGGAGAPLRSMYKREATDKPEVFDYMLEKFGPAEEKGIQPGDIIRELGRDRVASTQQYRDKVGALEEGETILLLIERDGRTRFFALRRR